MAVEVRYNEQFDYYWVVVNGEGAGSIVVIGSDVFLTEVSARLNTSELEQILSKMKELQREVNNG